LKNWDGVCTYDFARNMTSYCKHEMNKAEWNRVCSTRTTLLRVITRTPQEAQKWDYQCESNFVDGKFVVGNEVKQFEQGPGRGFNHNYFDQALDVHRVPALPADPYADPKTLLYLPHTIRREFNDQEKFRKQWFDKCEKFSHAKWKLEVNWCDMYDKLTAEYKTGRPSANRMGHKVYYGYTEGLANRCEFAHKKGADHVKALVEKTGATLVISINPTIAVTAGHRFKLQDGKLWVEMEPTMFACNLSEFTGPTDRLLAIL